MEYALVTAAFLCVVMAGAALWRALASGLFAEHGLLAASHHMQGSAGWLADILSF